MILAALALVQAVPAECAALERPNMTRAQAQAVISCVNREVARRMSASLPTRVDESTTLIGVIAAGPTVIYSMRIDGLREDYSREDIARQEQQVRDNVCGTPEMRSVIGYGGSYQYVWLDREGRRMHSFAIETCPPTAG